ncbi:hypothetical protein F441_22925 [Phytophthora nicotianae CJ01A1]|uniref:Uncharacterized protein n=1 Tax=Phytophthora nicotianae CJ01A1 TaxID=1317063 RepID=W2VN17_PHYNI|nr:hypothetical protein F441_22925 [Phytophthora nicotianae CJ01A1]
MSRNLRTRDHLLPALVCPLRWIFSRWLLLPPLILTTLDSPRQRP